VIAILRSCLVGIKAEGESGGQGQKNDKSNLQSWKKNHVVWRKFAGQNSGL
jgi:hypothetical protein